MGQERTPLEGPAKIFEHRQALFAQRADVGTDAGMALSAFESAKTQHGHQTGMLFLDFNRPTRRVFQEISDFAPGIIAIPLYRLATRHPEFLPAVKR